MSEIKGEKEFFKDFKSFVNSDSFLSKYINPYNKPMHSEFKKNKKKVMYLATASSVNGSYEPLCKKLSKNIKFNGEPCEFHSAYFGGDVHIFIYTPKIITESVNDVITESIDTKGINTVIFDLGSVLIKNTTWNAVKSSSKFKGLSDSDIKTLAITYYENIHKESDTASIEDALYVYQQKLPDRLKKYAYDMFHYCATSKEIYDYTIPLLQYLKKKGYKIYYLSNWARSGFTLLKKSGKLNFLNLFHGGIISYEVGYLKPDEAIYKLLLKKYNLQKEHCIFFDDKKENCDAGNKIGIKSVVFTKDTVKDIMDFPEVKKYLKENTICIKEPKREMISPKKESVDIMEAVAGNTHIMMENLYPKVSDILSTPVGDRKFKHLVGQFMDRNATKLHTAGPTYMIPFADRDKAEFFNLFQIDVKWLKGLIKQVTDKIGSGSAFKLLSDNPIYWVFYCVIRYYDLKKDQKGLNTALAIYALSNYPSVFHMSFPYAPNPAVMQYTMDNLSEKFIMKRAGTLFNGLFQSINNSFAFLEPFMKDASDQEMIRFIQRIRNDQKSMFKNICDQYMYNHAKGNRVKLNLDSNDAVQVDVDAENNTTIVQTVADSVVTQIITDGLDLRRVTICKDIAQIGLSDCRFYLSKIICDKYTASIKGFIYSILFLFLYTDKRSKQDINSSFFLKWSTELFRKTNSNDPNISNIKGTLDKWAEETGVHAKFKREASRVNYKKAIFWYFILSIQYYNK